MTHSVGDCVTSGLIDVLLWDNHPEKPDSPHTLWNTGHSETGGQSSLNEGSLLGIRFPAFSRAVGTGWCCPYEQRSTMPS
jgi:hypothetical protein